MAVLICVEDGTTENQKESSGEGCSGRKNTREERSPEVLLFAVVAVEIAAPDRSGGELCDLDGTSTSRRRKPPEKGAPTVAGVQKTRQGRRLSVILHSLQLSTKRIPEGAVRRRRRWPPEVRLEWVRRQRRLRVGVREDDQLGRRDAEAFKSRNMSTYYIICIQPPSFEYLTK